MLGLGCSSTVKNKTNEVQVDGAGGESPSSSNGVSGDTTGFSVGGTYLGISSSGVSGGTSDGSSVNTLTGGMGGTGEQATASANSATTIGGSTGMSGGAGGAGGTASGGEGGIGVGSTAGGGTAGTGVGGNPPLCDGVCECQGEETRPCSDAGLLGNCAAGVQTCVDGEFGPCSIQPAEVDSCNVPGDDANCDQQPNGGCTCTTGEERDCGPANEQGICEFGVSSCVDAEWQECEGAVLPKGRDCTSAADNDCDGVPDNNLDGTCTCTPGDTEPCDTHPGRDGFGPCKAGVRTCLAGAGNRTSAWSSCQGAVAPAASDLCTVDGDDSNCNDAPNDSCDCVLGESESCGTIYGSLGVCAQTSLSCRASGTWPAASSCAPTSAEVCNALGQDEDCDGVVDEGCNCHDPSSNNLLHNPGFDLPGQTTDWTLSEFGCSWSAEDADDCEESGSMRVEITPDFFWGIFNQCVRVDPNTTYRMGYSYKRDNGTRLVCQVLVGSTANCSSGGTSEGSATLQSDEDDGPKDWTTISTTLSTGPNANTAWLTCQTSVGVGFFDRIFLSTGSAGF